MMRETFAGRLLVVGILLKLAVALVRAVSAVGWFVTVLDTIGSVALAIGGAAFLWMGLSAARRRLLWRVRRKPIISYIFVGLIPALLIVTFFLLGGFLLFSNFSSYLVQNRLTGMADRALAIAEATALEVRLADGRDARAILARRQQSLVRETPGASIVLIPMTAECGDFAARRGTTAGVPSPILTAGPWAHLEAPREVPTWIGCEGYAGVVPFRVPGDAGAGTADAKVEAVIRAVALPQGVPSGYAALIDFPVDAAVKATLRSDVAVQVSNIAVLQGAGPSLEGPGSAEDPDRAASTTSGFLPTIGTFEHRDWGTGTPGTLGATMTLSPGGLYARLVDAQGSVEGLSVGQLTLVLLASVGLLLFFIQAVAFATGLALARSITGSVHELFTGTVKVRQGDFTHRIGVTARDQLGALAESFNSMTASIETLLLEAAEKKRLEEELRIAHDIQMSLLPQAPASIPGISVAALCVPAREVGGDYYDFLPLDDHRMEILIADVAGKGTSAALYMAELKGLMLSLSRTYSSPRELLIAANRLIAAHLDARSFITTIYALIDRRQGTLTYARAGHTPLLYLPGGPAARAGVRALTPDGMVLGLRIDEGQLFERLLEEQTLPLRSGDVYLLYTDGLTEAMNGDADCFGDHRVCRFIEEHAHLPCAELRERMVREVASFVDGAPQHDDMTLILLKVDDLAAIERPASSSASHAMAAEVVRS
jgi:sigma-B regulation protein RsbU (phosphoserine phosphatase)